MPEKFCVISEMVQEDPRYPVQAYLFLQDALAYATDSIEVDGYPEERPDRHLSGQELCDSIREYALNQFGYMAQVVLASWGITATRCFGDIVYNMIDVGLMKKSENDCPSHFDNVYEFDEAFNDNFVFCCRTSSQRRV